MAKFEPGDKVTWQHHNGSYSSEVIDYIVPPNGYAFKDGGVGAESELRAGWVPESQTGRANMPPLNSRACNGVRSRNAAPSAQLKMAYDEWKKAAEKFKKWFGSGRRLSERIPAGADDTKKKIEFSDLFFKETGRRPPNGYGDMTLEQMLASNSQNCVRSRNSVVAKALNACARNANFGSVEDAERYSEQEVRAAKSRINGEVVSLTDVIKLLKGYPDSKTVQKNLVTLQWALDAVKKAAQTLA